MITVEEILMLKGPDVIIASSGDTVQDAAKLMGQANVGSVIIKDGGQVTGIFTERDLLKRVVSKAMDTSKVKLGEVMSSPVRSCNLSHTVFDCIGMLTDEHIRHLAVIEDGALVGVIGLRDVMSAQLRAGIERIHELEERTLQS